MVYKTLHKALVGLDRVCDRDAVGGGLITMIDQSCMCHDSANAGGTASPLWSANYLGSIHVLLR
jgi:hypothetical protein